MAVVVAGIAAAALGSGLQVQSDKRSGPSALDAVREGVAAAYGKLPMRFEPNRGQGAPGSRFLSTGPGYRLSLTRREAVLSLTAPASGAKEPRRAVVRLGFAGANPQPQIDSAGRQAGVSNYLVGRNRSDWHTGIPGYARVRYRGLYPGIDMVFHGTRQRLEYDFIVAPGRDPKSIAIRFTGARRLALSRSGDLLVSTAAGTLRQRKPIAYQETGGVRRPVKSRYLLRASGTVAFGLGAYDRSRPLVIDPELVYTSGIAGRGAGIAADASGSAYIAGPDGLSKLSPSGDALVYSTTISGARLSDVEVDSEGRAYVTGEASTGFPATAGAFSDQPDGAFVAVVKAQGSDLDYASTLPGTGGAGPDTRPRGVAIDSARNVYIAGATKSDGLPVRSPAAAPFQAGRAGGSDGFVAKFNPAASADASLVYATYLGGAGDELAPRVAVDSAGSAHLTGATSSTDFPTQNALQVALSGGQDAFVTKLSPQGSALAYSTYLGGTGDENLRVTEAAFSQNVDAASMHVAVDAAGETYVSGNTFSTDFPTARPVQGANAGGADAYVAKIDPDLAGTASLVYSTYLGGGADDGAQGLGVDVQGGLHVAGFTRSEDFPTVDPLAPRAVLAPSLGETPILWGEAFVARVRPDGLGLSFSTYFGGGRGETANDLALDPPGNAYVVGRTTSADLPGISLGTSNEFVTKIAPGVAAAPVVTGLSTRSAPSEGGTSVAISGRGFGGASAVSFGGVAAESFTVDSPSQITAVTPPRPYGPAPVVVTAPVGSSPPNNPIATVTYGDGYFSPTGPLVQPRSRAVAALLQDGRVLVAGGTDAGGTPLTSAELYDPVTGTWAPTGGLNAARPETMTVLHNGRVLVTGATSADAELYNPVTGNWSARPTPRPQGSGSRATLLPDGRVLVTNSDIADLYDPTSSTWSATGSMNTARTGHGATVLSGPQCAQAARPSYCGKVLVAGGGGPSAELWDPADGSWSLTGELSVPRSGTAMSLLDGRVVMADGGPRSADTYDPDTGTWMSTGTPQAGRRSNGVTLLPSGRVLYVGGVLPRFEGTNLLNSAEVYDPTQPAGDARFTRGLMTHYRSAPFAVLLSSATGCGTNCGKVLIGGDAVQAGRATELYTPARGRTPVPQPQPPEPPIPGDPVPPPPSDTRPPAAPGPTVDAVRPALSGLSVADRSFSIGSLLPRLARASRVGTTIRFRLSEAATVRLSFARARPGRRVGRSCRTPSPRLRSRRACTRYVTVRPVVVLRGARAGANSVRFQGRLSRARRLRAGRHQVTATATDATGNRSTPRSTRFRLLAAPTSSG